MGKRSKTPTFLLELPLQVDAQQAKRIRAHLEAGRQFYNAVLSEGQKRLRQMRADPAWQAARAATRPETGAPGRFLSFTGAVWLQRNCPARLCQRGELHLDC